MTEHKMCVIWLCIILMIVVYELPYLTCTWCMKLIDIEKWTMVTMRLIIRSSCAQCKTFIYIKRSVAHICLLVYEILNLILVNASLSLTFLSPYNWRLIFLRFQEFVFYCMMCCRVKNYKKVQLLTIRWYVSFFSCYIW